MRSLREILGRSPRPAGPWMPPEDEFRRLLERERARSDRNRRSFSLVEFDTHGLEPESLASALALLKHRRRLTDDLGWVRRNAVGVLLAETDAVGARLYLEDVRRLLEAAGCPLSARIFVYEGARPGDRAEGPLRRLPGETPSAFRRRAQDRMAPPDDDGPQGDAPEGSTARGLPPPPERAPAPPDPGPGAADPGQDGIPPEADPGGPRRDGAVADMSSLFQAPMPWWKRLTDLVLAWILLVGISPVMLAVALLVKATSRGPIIFRQQRAGRGGKPFVFFKFRTMVDGADAQKGALRKQNELDGPVFKMKRDPRITPLGRILRRTSLDELPQLWNVIKGDMSLVGPRPPTLDEVEKYAAWQARRLDLTGGITGLWQVSGRNEIGFEEWMRMDIRYARTRSPATDAGILFRTIRAVLTGRGAS